MVIWPKVRFYIFSPFFTLEEETCLLLGLLKCLKLGLGVHMLGLLEALLL